MNEVEIFKVLSDENRYKIFCLLLFKESCICKFEDYFGLKQANISKHMKRLRDSNMVIARKEAQWVYYSINPQFVVDNSELVEYLKTKSHQDEQLKELFARIEKGACKLNV